MGRTESTAHPQRRLARHADAALYNPVWTSSVNSPGSFAVALVGFVLLTVWNAPSSLRLVQPVALRLPSPRLE
jgi:hypothetical protein